MKQKVIALGFFDGVHLGHGALLQATVRRAQELQLTPAVFTFDRPPKEVVTGHPVPLINSPEDRAGIVHRLYGIDEIIMAPFDQRMMTMPWQDFIEKFLVGEHGAAYLVAGHDFHFGHKNQGNPELLQQKCRELGVGCDIIPRVTLDGVTISSTYIRQLVENGELERAAAFLGHPHTLSQTVQHGRRLGRTIGIPTVNLEVPAHVLVPKYGVYATRVYLPDGTCCLGVTNVGTRPTVSENGHITVESFLIDYGGNLYGQELRVEFYKRLRGELKFESLDALKGQIEQDIQSVRDYFAAITETR